MITREKKMQPFQVNIRMNECGKRKRETGEEGRGAYYSKTLPCWLILYGPASLFFYSPRFSGLKTIRSFEGFFLDCTNSINVCVCVFLASLALSLHAGQDRSVLARLEEGLLESLQKLHSVSRLPQFCLLYTSPSPRDQRGSRMPSSA